MRCSSRSHQTRCGMWCTSGLPPVAIDERQTGVSDGNVDAARRYVPCSARKRERRHGALARLEHRRRQAVDRRSGRRFFAATHSRRACAGRRALGRAAAQPRAERRHRERLEIAEHGTNASAAPTSAAMREQHAVPPRVPPRRSAPATSGAEPSAPQPRRRAPADRSPPRCQSAKRRAPTRDRRCERRAPISARRSAPVAATPSAVPEPDEDADRVPGAHRRPV